MRDGRYLTVELLLFIHDQVIGATGGSHGVRDLGGLESAVAIAWSGVSDQELYPSIWEKAAALIRSIIQNHPFVDGNKRTGIAASAIFLEYQGWELDASDDEVVAFALWIALQRPAIAEIAGWLEQHCRRALP